MRRALVSAAVATAALAGLAPAAGAGDSATSPKRTVTLKDIEFHPSTMRIHAGQRVTWKWDDPYVLHNIHSVGAKRFTGASTRKTGTYSFRFTHGGTYKYVCTVHPGMKGKVVVS